MEKKLLNDFKKQLEERRESLVRQLGNIGDQAEGAETNFNATFPQYGDSAEDNAVEVADYAKNLSVEKELEKELRDVEKAIRKMEDGTYGVCGHCGKEISVERLRVRPESGSCIACKNAITGKR